MEERPKTEQELLDEFEKLNILANDLISRLGPLLFNYKGSDKEEMESKFRDLSDRHLDIEMQMNRPSGPQIPLTKAIEDLNEIYRQLRLIMIPLNRFQK